MVRPISVASQAKLDQNLGTEPVVIIQIQWVDGGSVYTYADKDLGGGEGKILEVSGLDNTIVIQGVQAGVSGDSQSISVTLDDTDGTIKQSMDTHDIHKEPAWVYQWFTGLATTEKFLVFKGQISSPIQWNEGDRTVKFDIITRIEDAEVGFSMEEGNFDYVPEELVGKPWPLIFGTVEDCEALRTRSPRKGLLKTGFGIRDFVLSPKLEQLRKVCCPLVFVGFRSHYEASASGGPWGAGTLVIEAVFEPDVRCTCKKRALECEIQAKITAQSGYEYASLVIIDGEYFPQGVYITLDIGGAKVFGKFNGTASSPSSTFLVANYIHPKKADGSIVVPPITNFGCDPPPDGSTNQRPNEIGIQRCVISVSGSNVDCTGWGSTVVSGTSIETIEGTREQVAWNYLSTFQEAGFFWAEPGSEVTLDTDNEIVYVANLLPSTIHYVKAYRTFEISNIRRLTTIPNSYYTTRTSDFGGYQVAEIVFNRPLSSLGEGWEDEIYVTLTSSVGNNTVDEMEWLIDKYTDFSWDSSFATVKTKIDKYPMNFKVPDRMNILRLLQDMAFQARCALTLRNDQFHLTYLSDEPNQDGTITEDDVIYNTLVLDHTNTEDLVTKFVAKWRPTCNENLDPYQVILRYNVNRYGTQEKEFNFYCFNIQELVIKSATFWLIRMANTWRKIICQTPINKLALESIDGVYVTLPDIANGQIKCRVESAIYNSEDHAIDFVIWTPVRSGSKDAYDFAYPAQIDVNTLHPTNEDLQFGNAGGSGPNVDVEPPEGHVLGSPEQLPQGFSFGQKSPCQSLSGGTTFNRPIDLFHKCRPDHGDQKPSDTDDVKPTKAIKTDNTSVPPTQEPVNAVSSADARATANELQQEGTNNQLSGGVQDAQNNGTGSTTGAGQNGGSGSLSDNGSGTLDTEQGLKDYIQNLPDRDQLAGTCYWGFQVYFLNPVTSVRIPNGETCTTNSPQLCNSGNGWCYCAQPGKSGCAVGNQVVTVYEEYIFGSEAERDAAKDTVDSIIDSQGTVGTPHPVFTVNFANTDDCEASDNPSIIGYGTNGDGSQTLLGYHNFLLGDLVQDDCVV